jgi:hypothetical protein
VDAERNNNLKKAKVENGFYNIIDGEKVAASKRLSVILFFWRTTTGYGF